MFPRFSTQVSRWSAVSFFVALVWAIELFIVQESTLIAIHPGPRALWACRFLRASLNFSLFFTLVNALRFPWLMLLEGVYCGFCLGVVVYHRYFQRTLSVLTILSQWQEGSGYAGYALTLVPKSAVILLAVGLFVKILVLWRRGDPPPRRRALLASGLVAYVLLTLLAALYDNPRKINDTRDLGRIALARGYVQAWIAEWWYIGRSSILQRAIACQTSTDQLRLVESEFPVRKRLVIVQLEAIGYDLIDRSINGRELIPVLNTLRSRSFFYRVRSPRINGSADADFCMLMGCLPASEVINYKIPNFPYDESLPAFCRRFHCRSSSYVADPGFVYSRREPFYKMGFDQCLFEEEMTAQFGFEPVHLGIRDADLFSVSKLALRGDAVGRGEHRLHFLINVCSHAPWNMLRRSEQEVFPDSDDMNENYFNSVRYVDNCIRDYVTGLPQGTTCLIYGDHTVGVLDYDGYRPDRDATGDFVPVWLYNVDEDVAPAQATRGRAIALDGSLSLVDVAQYLRRQIEKSWSSHAGRSDDEGNPPTAPAPRAEMNR